jgi:GntR family transcriptional repressor for pyruvate dehydrogenase complex
VATPRTVRSEPTVSVANSVADSAEPNGGAVFRPLYLRRAADEVVAVIVDAIRGGAYAVGDALPKERELAEQLGVSRPVIAQAIATLRNAGIVTSRRGARGGTFVTSVDALSSVMRGLRGPMRDNIRAILETRRGLELTAGLLAAQHATDEQLAELSALADELETAVKDRRPTAETWDIDIRFHQHVATVSGNRPLARFLNLILDDLTHTREEFPFGHVARDTAVRNQRAHADALVRRDPRLIVEAVDRHLASLEEVYLGERLEFMPITATRHG